MWQLITNSTDWDAQLLQLPAPHVLQSWAWGEFKSRWGWTAQRWRLTGSSGQPRAMMQLLRRRAGRLPMCVLYAPKGPLADSAESYELSLRWIEQQAKAQRAIWAKVDGDTALDGAMFTPEHLRVERQALTARGWRYSADQVQFRNTMCTDLRRSEEELLAAMKQKWRYNIRLAEKRGVRIRAAAADELPALYAMYAETGQRDGFAIREQDYYLDAWRSLGATALIAEHDSVARPLAALVLFRFGERAWYFYGMSRDEGREHMPNYLLQWTALRWAREHGCAVYDWWGAPEQLNEQDSMWGVYRFKEGFGAVMVEGLGAWDYAPVPWIYQLYERWVPALLRRLRR